MVEETKTIQKTILVTGSTDGIGLETAGMWVSLGYAVLLHGRNPANLEKKMEIYFLALFRDARIPTAR